MAQSTQELKNSIQTKLEQSGEYDRSAPRLSRPGSLPPLAGAHPLTRGCESAIPAG